MTVAYVTKGAGAAASVLFNSGAVTFSHTGTTGNTVLLILEVGTGTMTADPTYATHAMTLQGSSSFLRVYSIVVDGSTVPSGSQTVSFLTGFNSPITANTFEYSGVGTVGTPVFTTGTGASPNTASTTVPTGGMELGAITYGGGSGFNYIASPTGGTNRDLVNDPSGNGNFGYSVSDADPSASPVTFGAFLNTGGAPYVTVTVALNQAVTNYNGSASTTATASLTAAGTANASTGASTTATVGLTAAGSVAGAYSGTTSITVTATLTAAGAVGATSGASTAAAAALTATGTRGVSGSASRTVAATLTAAGVVTNTLIHVALTAAGAVAPGGQASTAVSVALTAAGIAGGGGTTTPTSSPLAAVGGRLAAGQDQIIQVIGDSLAMGTGDEVQQIFIEGIGVGGTIPGAHPITDISDGGAGDYIYTALAGWPAKLGDKIAAQQNCSCRIKKWQPYHGAVYDDWVTVRTGPPGSPMLSIYSGTYGGTPIATHMAWVTSYDLIQETPDVIIHNSAANDIKSGLQPAQYVDVYKSFVELLFTTCPGVPIVLTNGTDFNINFPGVYFIDIALQSWHLTLGFADSDFPLTPAIQNVPLLYHDKVWFMDTAQSLGRYNSATYWGGDSFHPNNAGYNLEAQFMLPYFVGAVAPPSLPVITTPSLDSMTRGHSFSQTLHATGGGIHWTPSPGSILPDGLTLGETSGVLSGTPTGFGRYSFTVRASNAQGNNDKTFTGDIDPGGLPFIPTGTVQYKQKLAGFWYPVKLNAKVGGTFKHAVIRR